MKLVILSDMDPVLAYVQEKQPELIALLREMVECESPTDNPQAVDRFVELMVERTRDLATPRIIKGKGGFGSHLQLKFAARGVKKPGKQLLALGHSDTVWPLGTLKTMPWREADGRLWGPGVLDMKSGVAFFIYAMQALRDLDLPLPRPVVLQLNSDEEVGSNTSRALTEKEAQKSAAVLVLEPGTGLQGKLKTARKGVGRYLLKVRGVASHAGVDFEAGASAIVELAHQIEVIDGMTRLKKGLTVNPGVISGGTRSNVIAAEAEVEIDVRVTKLKHAASIDKKLRALKPVNKRCTLTIEGELNRPPMERTPEIGLLFQKAQELALEMGVHIEESSTGGGSDGNFTAAIGVPTIDGLGGVGEGAHAVHESILIDRIADRTALLAKLAAAI